MTSSKSNSATDVPLDVFGGWSGVLSDLVAGVDLTPAAARAALGSILRGEATDAQVAGFIIALGMKGGSVLELTGLVDAMMDAASPLDVPDGTIDIVGSGGAPSRRAHALSVSSMACFVASAAGATVCKHGSVLAHSGIILAGSDVSGGTTKVNLQTVRRFLLPAVPSNPRKVCTHLTRTIIAHRVGRIMMHLKQRFVIIEKGDGF